MAHIVKFNKFNTSKINCEPVAKNKAGGNIVYLKYNEAKKIIIQTPIMMAPFGLSVFNDEANGVSKYSVDLSFKGQESDKNIEGFLNCMTNLDNFMIEQAVQNSKEWFGKKMSKEVVKELYRPLIKESKDPSKYASTIKFKIRNTGDKLNLEAFDDKQNSFDMDNFAPGCKARAIVELSSIWFVNKQFGCSFTVVQMQVSKPEKVQGFSFQPDTDDEEEEDEEESEYDEDEA